MKKYKLIKEYPGSPELGSERTGSEENCRLYPTKKCMENSPEFWEEVIEKDYEILSFISNQPIGDVEKNTVLLKYEQNFKFWREPPLFDIISTEKKLLKNNKWNIHSVKRLSDGEVFTVGDKITDNCFTEGGNNRIRIINEKIYLDTDSDKCTSIPLNKAFKVKKLFTTEDGVDIFVGDTYYWVNTYFELNEEKINHEDDAGAQETAYNVLWNFSTKEAAEEYILMNKPCLSINDILNITYNPVETRYSTTNKLKKIVRTKI